MSAEGKSPCYHSCVTECEEWQGGARGLIGVNSCGVELGLCLLGDAQSMRVKRSIQQALKESSYIYLLSWFWRGNFYEGLQQSGEWEEFQADKNDSVD